MFRRERDLQPNENVALGTTQRWNGNIVRIVRADLRRRRALAAIGRSGKCRFGSHRPGKHASGLCLPVGEREFLLSRPPVGR